VTINEDGSPQTGRLGWPRRRAAQDRQHPPDPRVAVSFEASENNETGMSHYLVVHGRARLTEGGAPELLHRLA
jgi:hypothetical protein